MPKKQDICPDTPLPSASEVIGHGGPTLSGADTGFGGRGGGGGPNDPRAFVWENLRCHVHFCETINTRAILSKLGCLFA